MKSSFFLVIPEQKNNPDDCASYEEATLQQWISELPTANPSLSARLFHDLVAEMNALQMPTQKRIDALEMLRPTLLEMEDYLRSKLVKSGYPKGHNEEKIMDALTAIEKHFTIGYWICARDLTVKDGSWFQGKTIALSIQRTIRGLSSVIVTHFIMNTPIPDWIWIDIHSLYNLSVKLKKHNIKVSDQMSSGGKTQIDTCYKQIMLLSLANPAGLMQKEYQLCYKFIGKLAHLIEIVKKPDARQKNYCVILLDEDSPPIFTTDLPEIDDSVAFLNLAKLLKIKQTPEKFSSIDEPRFSFIDSRQVQSEKLSTDLFNYLMQRWEGQALSGDHLFPDRMDRLLVIGLAATHNTLSPSSRDYDPPVEIRAETNSEYSLSCRFETQGVLSIGSLLSFRRPDDSKLMRQLAIVSKLTLPKQDNQLLFELSAIANQAYAITYIDLEEDNEDPQQHKGLLYAVKQNEAEKSFILMDSFSYKDGSLLRLYLQQESFPVILRDRRNIGLGYWQFECRRLPESALEQLQPQKKKEKETKKKKKGFDFI